MIMYRVRWHDRVTGGQDERYCETCREAEYIARHHGALFYQELNVRHPIAANLVRMLNGNIGPGDGRTVAVKRERE